MINICMQANMFKSQRVGNNIDMIVAKRMSSAASVILAAQRSSAELLYTSRV